MTGIPRILLALLAVSLLWSACGAPEDSTEPGAGSPASPDPDAPIGCYDPVSPPENTSGLTPCPNDLGGSEVPQRVEPRADLVDVSPHRWDRVDVGDDDRDLDVIFWGGVEECYGVDRVEVEERRRRVVVTLYTGRVPTAEVCIELAVEQFVRVRLDEPLGVRKVVDGAPS